MKNVEPNIEKVKEFIDEHITNGKRDIQNITYRKSGRSDIEHEYTVTLETGGFAFNMDCVKDLKWIQVFSDGKVLIETELGDIYLKHKIPVKDELERMGWKIREISNNMNE